MAKAQVPPHSLPAERAILGCVLMEGPAALAKVDLEPIAFYPDSHRAIFAAMRGLAERGAGVSTLTVTDELSELGQLELVGGPAHLALCQEEASIEAYLPRYVEIVRREWIRRESIQECQHAMRDLFGTNGHGPAVSLAEIAVRMGDRLARLAEQVEPDSVRALRVVDPQPVGAVLEEIRGRLDRGEQERPLPTPIPALNTRLGGGLRSSELVYLGGRPGSAKTALALQWAVLAAQYGFKTLVVSREMRNSALGRRLMAQQAQIAATALRRGDLDLEERQRFDRALPRLAALPLWFDDASETIGQIRRAVRAGGFHFVVVDYVQLIRSPQDASAKRLEVTAVSRGLKSIVQRYGCALLALSSLRRLLRDKGKRLPPDLDDLKESGDLEHDADIVLLLHQPDEDKRDRALLFKKLREGESGGHATLDWQPIYVRFTEVESGPSAEREPGDETVPF
jgi:replicative DNA helicase